MPLTPVLTTRWGADRSWRLATYEQSEGYTALRTALSMARAKAFPKRFGHINQQYQTPDTATWWMGALSIIWYVGLTLVSEDILFDSIAALGLMIAFYYGMTGFACVWYFRRDLNLKGWQNYWHYYKDLGYRLVGFDRYETAAGTRYAGVWRQNSERPTWGLKAEVDARVSTELAVPLHDGVDTPEELRIEMDRAAMRREARRHLALDRLERG